MLRPSTVKRPTVALALCAALVALAACGQESGPPASDPGGGSGDDVIAELTVEVKENATARARTATLQCGSANSGTGWLADDPESACRAVTANERLLTGKAVVKRRVCTQVFGGPQQASVTGDLGGRRVQFAVARSDGCGIGDWDALEALLGPPPGDNEPY